MTSKGKRPLRHLTASDKIEAIQRIHDGESKASVARDIGVPESTLRGWCKNEDKLRFMSRQGGPDKMAEQLAEKMNDNVVAAATAVGLLAGPPEKRQKLDSSLPLNFSSKIKYEDLYNTKRNSLNGLDYSSSKPLSDLSFNGLGQDYSVFAKTDLSSLNGSCKNKGYGADLTKQNDIKADLSMGAISPLTSLSHLSGMTGLAQSSLGLSFNDIATNLNLIAHLNPSLAAMSSLNGLTNPNNNAMRNIKPKPPSHSPRNDLDVKPQVLSVKNWAKCGQKSAADVYGMNLTDLSTKSSKHKTSQSSSLSGTQSLMPRADIPTDENLWCWLKSHQAVFGLNSIYASMPSAASPIRSSTPQIHIPQHNQHTAPTPPAAASTPQTPSSTPSGSSEDTKNSTWFWQFYKTFGANLLADKTPATPKTSMNTTPNNNNNNHSRSSSNNNNSTNNNNHNHDHDDHNINTNIMTQVPYENILYSHLTKDTAAINSDNLNNNEINSQSSNKPEDLSAKPSPRQDEDINDKITIKSEIDPNSNAKEALDNLLYSKTSENNLNNNNNNSNITDNNIAILNNNNNLSNNNNNNNNHINTDIKSEFSDPDDLCHPLEALEHGEKFLKWLESYSDPRITAMQVMQFRYLLNTIRSSTEQANSPSSQSERIRIRRRK